jgi:hypothetical protein
MATRTGKRNMNWRNDEATLYYVEALEGNPENKVDFRDDVFQWKAPLMKPCANTKKTTF